MVTHDGDASLEIVYYYNFFANTWNQLLEHCAANLKILDRIYSSYLRLWELSQQATSWPYGFKPKQTTHSLYCVKWFPFI